MSTARHANHLRPSPAASRTLSTTASSGAPPRSGRSEIDITKDYYDILGVVPDATATEIREAFYDAARRLHPDVNPVIDLILTVVEDEGSIIYIRQYFISRTQRPRGSSSWCARPSRC